SDSSYLPRSKARGGAEFCLADFWSGITENFIIMTKATAKDRCFWCDGIPEFGPYHDKEWGFPVADDRVLFEKLTLEGFQSGLSWRTILNKRENFRAGFANFEIERVARFKESDIKRLLKD